jgi:hypothetical protein
LSIGLGKQKKGKKKSPEILIEHPGFRVVRRFITGIINPF